MKKRRVDNKRIFLIAFLAIFSVVMGLLIVVNNVQFMNRDIIAGSVLPQQQVSPDVGDSHASDVGDSTGGGATFGGDGSGSGSTDSPNPSGYIDCSDGTAHGECSESVEWAGYICNDGTLISDCGECGSYCYVPEGTSLEQVCQNPEGCLAGALANHVCFDGTVEGQCSDYYQEVNDPYYRCDADSLQLVADCTCGCPNDNEVCLTMITGPFCTSNNDEPVEPSLPNQQGSIPSSGGGSDSGSNQVQPQNGYGQSGETIIGQNVNLPISSVSSSKKVRMEGLYEGDVISFVDAVALEEFSKELIGHSIEVKDVSDFTVRLVIKSDPISVTLNLGECKDTQLDNVDLTVCLVGIDNDRKIDLDIIAMPVNENGYLSDNENTVVGAAKKLFTQTPKANLNTIVLSLVILIVLILFIAFLVILFKGKNEKRHRKRV